MNEFESRVSSLLLTREKSAPAPRPDLAATITAAVQRRRSVRRIRWLVGALVLMAGVVLVAPWFVDATDQPDSSAPAGPSAGLDDAAIGPGPRDGYTATLECYSYQTPSGPQPVTGSPAAKAGPRAAFERWWKVNPEIGVDWNTDVVVQEDDDSATEVVARGSDASVAAIVHIRRIDGYWHVTSLNTCE